MSTGFTTFKIFGILPKFFLFTPSQDSEINFKHSRIMSIDISVVLKNNTFIKFGIIEICLFIFTI